MYLVVCGILMMRIGRTRSRRLKILFITIMIWSLGILRFTRSRFTTKRLHNRRSNRSKDSFYKRFCFSLRIISSLLFANDDNIRWRWNMIQQLFVPAIFYLTLLNELFNPLSPIVSKKLYLFFLNVYNTFCITNISAEINDKIPFLFSTDVL